MFELSQIRCFVSVASELNFRRAAERLNMTQPPLSRQIQLLEHRLGVVLFERNKRSVRLTAAGGSFFIEAQRLLEQARSATLAVRRVARGDCGSVTIGFVPSAAFALLPSLVSRLHAAHPGVDIALKEMDSLRQLDAVQNRQVDFGIVRSTLGRRGLAVTPLGSEPFVLAVPVGHPLAEEQRAAIAALDGQPFIMYSITGWLPFFELLGATFRAAGVWPDYVHHVDSTVTMLALVNAGIGLALVPASAACLGFARVRFLPLDPDPGMRSELFLIWHDNNDNPACRSITATLRAAGNA